GQFAPNERGLFDLVGNVKEWCQEPFANDLNESTAKGTSWDIDGKRSCAAGIAYGYPPDDLLDVVGFRCLLSGLSDSIGGRGTQGPMPTAAPPGSIGEKASDPLKSYPTGIQRIPPR